MTYRFRTLVCVICMCVVQLGMAQEKPFFLDAGLSFNTSKTRMIDRDASMALGVFIQPGFTISENWNVTWKIEPAAKVHGIAETEGASFKYGSNFILNNYFSLSRVAKRESISWEYGVSALMIYDYRYDTKRLSGGLSEQVRNHRLFPGFGVHGGVLIGKFKVDIGYYLPLNRYVRFAGLGVGYRF